MASDFLFATLALAQQTVTLPAISDRPVVSYSQVASSETPLPFGFRPVSILGSMTGSTLVGERFVGARSSEAERLVAGSLCHVQAIASVLPTDEEDERLIDELMTKRAAKLATRPLRRREG
jgi:hypothetical protein